MQNKEQTGEVVVIYFDSPYNDDFKECYYMEKIITNQNCSGFREELQMNIWPKSWGYDRHKDGFVRFYGSDNIDFMKCRSEFIDDIQITLNDELQK